MKFCFDLTRRLADWWLTAWRIVNVSRIRRLLHGRFSLPRRWFYGRFFRIVGRLAAWSIFRANRSLHKSPEINKRNDHALRSGKNKLILLQPCPKMEEKNSSCRSMNGMEKVCFRGGLLWVVGNSFTSLPRSFEKGAVMTDRQDDIAI